MAQVKVGDEVRLTADTVMALATAAPKTFQAIRDEAKTCGRITHLSDDEVTVDMGNRINDAHPSEENDPRKGITFKFCPGQLHRTVVPDCPVESQPTPAPPLTDAASDMFTAFEGAGGLPPGGVTASFLPRGHNPFSITRGLGIEVERVPVRVSTAQQVMQQFMYMRQFAVVIDMGSRNNSPADEGDSWKQGTDYERRPVELQLTGDEERLYNLSMGVIGDWLAEKPQEPGERSNDSELRPE